jgi:hypothetical protein
MSGADLTAREFDQHWNGADWRSIRARPAVSRVDFAEADHTFSPAAARAAVSVATITWLRRLPRS